MRAAPTNILLATLGALAVLAPATVLVGACVDSELTGSLDTLVPPDTGVIEDTQQDADSTPIDVPDGVDAGCTTNEQCGPVLGALGPCQVPLCDATRGVCFAGQRPNCCASAGDCPTDPNDPCTVGSCPVVGGSCQYTDVCGPCQLDSECQALAPACTQGRCDERGECHFDPIETCCVTANDCDDADPCTTQLCDAQGVCRYNDVGGAGCCTTPPVIATDFDAAPPFEATTTSESVFWSVIQFDTAPTPPSLLYLGNPNAYNLVSAQPIRAEAAFRLGPVQANEQVEVKLRIYLDAGPTPPMQVLVRYLNGQQVLVWDGQTSQSSRWLPVKKTVTMPRNGQAQLVLSYVTPLPVGDASLFGVAIDDLQVRTGCGSGGCQSDLQCATSDPCVIGRCGADGACSYSEIPECCRTAQDCGPSPECWATSCRDNRCDYERIDGCCVDDDECGPSPDPCFLQSRCFDNRCELFPTDVPCDDGDPCTADTCIQGACLHELIPECCVGPGCACQPDVADWDFEGSDQGWSWDDPVSGYGWYRVQVQAPGSPQMLYFGNPDAGPAIDPGFPLTATAIGPVFYVPGTATSVTVRFNAYVGLDFGQQTDQIRLVAVSQSGASAVLWQLGPNTPRYELISPTSQALSGFVGQNVRLRLVYLSQDNVAAEGFGFLVDDITVTAECGGVECVTPQQCPPGPPCTLRTCEQNTCGIEDLDCDDGDVCTDDFCDPDLGTCVHIPNGLAGCGGECQFDFQCADTLVCTNDFCDDGQCVHKPEPGCCQADVDCNDGDLCTVDQCAVDFGVCINQQIPGCGGCQFDDQCFDGDPCTEDRCQDDGQCSHELVPDLPGCICFNGEMCSDGDPCTVDICGETGQCLHIPDTTLPGCQVECQADFQCNDADPCTRDICSPDGVCFFQPDPNLPGCSVECSNDFQCFDDDPCTQDRCSPDGVCFHQIIPGLPGCELCGDNGDCDDGDFCTQDACTPQGTCTHTFVPSIPGCGGCEGPEQCSDGRVCTQDLCSAAGECLNLPIPGCCEGHDQCADGDPCTEDLCRFETGVCEHIPIPDEICGECDEVDCDDGDPCTTDSCNSFTGQCEHSDIAGCCETNSDCADGDQCTFDQCDNAVCTHTFLPLPGCQPECQTDADCEDGNPCTTNRCGPGGTCRINVIFGCCDSDDECEDGNACTTDTCYGQVGVCFNQQIGCNDNNACTADSCDPDSGCVFSPIPGCCTTGAQCNDGNPCTTDGCAGGQCFNTPNDSCCGSDADCFEPGCGQGTCLPDGQCVFTDCCEPGPTGIPCDDGNPCTEDFCADDGQCQHGAVPGCCTGDSQCPADEACVDWFCDPDQLRCVSVEDPSCCEETTAASFAFTGNLGGWGVEPAQTPGAVTWWISNRRSTSGPSSIYMGNPETGTYNNGGVPAAYATSPAFDVPDAPGVELSFNVWLDIEQFQNFDPFFVDVVTANGGASQVWAKTAVPGQRYRSWVATKANLTPWAGQTIRIRLRFEADDDLLNDTEGIYIDDLVVRALCEPVSLCGNDFECNDGDACTNDRCVANVCQANPIPGCCESTADCDDAYACTEDACVEGSCQNNLIAGCCVADGECDDGRACTTDACDMATHSCVFVDTGGCCTTAADCNDGDACTSDVCQPNGTCRHGANVTDPSCCEAGNFFEEHFSLSALTTFTVQGDGSQVRWRAYNGHVFTPPFALYYGNPATQDFDSGARTFGTATSDPIAIPTTAHATKLTFNVWLDVDGFPFDDLLSARVIVGGNAFTLWERTDLPFGSMEQWIPVTIDLPPQVAGRTIRVQFAFDSVDEQDNDGEGIYVDDVQVYSTCP